MARKILILEDTKAHMTALSKIITDLHSDIRVFRAYDTAEAIQIATEQTIHLFLIDIILTQKPGDVSGLNFAKEIRGITKYKFTPLIFITSLEDPKLYSYSQLHCYAYIEKPFDVQQIRETVLSALEFPIKEDDDRYVYFRKDGIVYSVYIREIVYAEIVRRKMYIHCVNDVLEVAYKSCEALLKDLNCDCFLQCRRSCIVNRRYIEYIDYTNRYIRLRYADQMVEIGMSVRKRFRQSIDNE